MPWIGFDGVEYLEKYYQFLLVAVVINCLKIVFTLPRRLL